MPSALYHKKHIAVIVILLALAGVIFLLVWSHRAAVPPNPAEPQLKISNRSFGLEIPGDAAARQRGLSGRDRLADDKAMLFVFEEAGRHCFWMKEMRFSIDIVWLDEDKRVVYIKEDADPASYPESFCPPSPAKYVLEFNAGTARQLGLAPGQQLAF